MSCRVTFVHTEASSYILLKPTASLVYTQGWPSQSAALFKLSSPSPSSLAQGRSDGGVYWYLYPQNKFLAAPLPWPFPSFPYSPFHPSLLFLPCILLLPLPPAVFLNQLMGLGERCELPSGVWGRGGAPAAVAFCNFCCIVCSQSTSGCSTNTFVWAIC